MSRNCSQLRKFMLYSSLFYPILPQRRIPARRPGEDVIQCLVQMFLGFVLFFGFFFGQLSQIVIFVRNEVIAGKWNQDLDFMGLKLLNVLSSQSGLTYGRMDYLDFIKRGECVCKLTDLNLHSYKDILIWVIFLPLLISVKKNYVTSI